MERQLQRSRQEDFGYLFRENHYIKDDRDELKFVQVVGMMHPDTEKGASLENATIIVRETEPSGVNEDGEPVYREHAVDGAMMSPEAQDELYDEAMHEALRKANSVGRTALDIAWLSRYDDTVSKFRLPELKD